MAKVRVTEALGLSRVLGLKSVTRNSKLYHETLRLLPRKSVVIDEESLSDEVRRAEKMGLIRITPFVETKVVKKETTTESTGGEK